MAFQGEERLTFPCSEPSPEAAVLADRGERANSVHSHMKNEMQIPWCGIAGTSQWDASFARRAEGHTSEMERVSR